MSGKYLRSVGEGLLFLILSLLILRFAGSFATSVASNSVTDLFLNNLPVINTSLIFNQGAILIWIIFAVTLFQYKNKLPFFLKSIALLILTRSFFVVLTHLGPVPGTFQSPNIFLQQVTFGGDLFFSGHTAYPFLAAFIFWEKRALRYFYFAASLIFGLAAILGHQHYSIDVFASPFIAYSIFRLSTDLFKYEWNLAAKNVHQA